MEYTVLVCDDDADILAALQIYLRQEGYKVLCASNGVEALQIVHNEDVHLVLLDIMMPVLDGIQAAVKIREFSNVPIIFLSAKSEDTDRILGLNMGGDDYVTKPFNPVELLARVRAVLRRYSRLGGLKDSTPDEQPNEVGVFQTGSLVLDDNLKLVTVDGEEKNLTAMEFRILRLLISNPERVFSSAQIYEAVWDEPAFQVSKIVSVHVRHIREKIEINPKEPQYLKVIYGLGYKVVKIP
ncbi:MAG: response regulator transcription factor [Symbiobacteriaceae bacterium]|nr:response regulator transcription factor [Symbiobacteriaceae bacterium]